MLSKRILKIEDDTALSYSLLNNEIISENTFLKILWWAIR